jgi:hypothetical protein
MEEMEEDGSDLPGGHEQEAEPGEEQEEEEGEPVLLIDGKPDVSEEEGAEEGEEERGKPAPSWVKELRQSQRDLKRQNRELQEKLAAKESPQQQAQALVLGKKPTMEDDDVDWDSEKFEAKLTKWHETKRQIEEQEQGAQRQQEEQRQAWQKKLDGHNSKKAQLKYPDVEEAEQVVLDTLDQTQQGIIVQGAKNSALLAYAIGRNPKRAAALAEIKDPIAFAFAVAHLEATLGTKSKKPSTTPEKVPSGQGRVVSSASGDATLDRLRDEAQRTGDMSKVHAYKRQQRAKGR